jgi:cation diffusion facilitator CzcD-associated flavoprotein CzcO
VNGDADAVVVGAGPAGLAVGACLKDGGVSTLLVDCSETPGSSWRRHYDRLHLHTPRGNSELPLLGFPRGTPRWPSRQQVVDYLEGYARHFQLDLRMGQEVTSVRHESDGWRTTTDRATYRSRFVVVATGYTLVPVVPSWPGRERFRGPLVHSSAYQNGEPYRGKRVLVVGFGNSGGEIAIDLHEHGARPALAVRSPVNVIARQVLGVPMVTIGSALRWLPPSVADALGAPISWLTVGDLRKLGLRKLPYGPITQIARHRRIPLIDVGTIDLIRKGHVQVLPGVRELGESEVVFDDGSRHAFDAVVAATGYAPRADRFVQVPDLVLDESGCPAASGAEVSPGLFFCGMHVAPSGMLHEIAAEARGIARLIATRPAPY